MTILFFLVWNIYSSMYEPLPKIIRVYSGVTNEEIEEEVKTLKEIYNEKFNDCLKKYEERTCIINNRDLDPNSVCNENGLDQKIKSVSKKIPILYILMFGKSGKVDLSLLKGKVSIVRIYGYEKESLPSKIYQNKKVQQSTQISSYKKDIQNNKKILSNECISIVGNIKNKVSYLYVAGIRTEVNVTIIGSPMDCETFEVRDGILSLYEQPIKSQMFRADEAAFPTINWSLVSCDQFICNIVDLMYYYYQLRFQSDSAILYSRVYYSEFEEIEYNNFKFIIPYESVNGKIGIHCDSTHFDIYNDASDLEQIKLINISFNDAAEPGDLHNPPDSSGKYTLYISSNSWNNPKPELIIIANDREYKLDGKECSLDINHQQPFEQDWSEEDQNSYKYFNDSSDDDGGLSKKNIIIIIVVCVVVVVVIVVIIVTVIVVKKKKEGQATSSNEEEN